MVNRNPRICLLAIIGLGLLLRFWGLDRLSFWYDETTSAGYVEEPGWQSMFRAVQGDVHPIGYFALLRLWSGIFGSSDFSLRGMSVLFGVLSIPLMFKVAGKVCAPPQAFLATLLFTLSPFQIYYSQETRAYALVTFLVLLSFGLFLDLIRQADRPARTAFLLGLVNAAIMYVNYCAALVVVAQVLAAATQIGGLLKGERRRLILLYGGSLIFSALLFAPWLKIFSIQFQAVQNGIWITRPDWDDLGDTLIAFMLRWRSRNANVVKILFGVLFLCTAVVLLRPFRHKTSGSSGSNISFRRDLLLTLVWLLFPILAGWLWSQGHSSIYIDRSFIGCSPALYLLIAMLSTRESVPIIRFVPVLLAFFVMIRMYPRLYTASYKEDWRGAVAVYEQHAAPKNQILFDLPAGRLTFSRYAKILPEAFSPESAVSAADEVWIIRSLTNERMSKLIRRLRRMGYSKTFTSKLTGVDLVRMRKSNKPAPPAKGTGPSDSL